MQKNERGIRTLEKRLTRKRQCKDKDHKETLLVAIVGLLEVVVSCLMLGTHAVRRVIVNGSVPLGDNKLCWLEKGNKEVSLVQCLREIKVGCLDLPVFNNRLHRILVL